MPNRVLTIGAFRPRTPSRELCIMGKHAISHARVHIHYGQVQNHTSPPGSASADSSSCCSRRMRGLAAQKRAGGCERVTASGCFRLPARCGCTKLLAGWGGEGCAVARRCVSQWFFLVKFAAAVVDLFSIASLYAGSRSAD